MIKILSRYLFYKLFAPHRHGFGVHSPFVFHLVSEVLPLKSDPVQKGFKKWRKELLHNKRILQTIDSGAGSKVHRCKGRTVGQVAGKSSIPNKYGRILYALGKEFQPASIIELGTGIGISTVYLAKACPRSVVISIDADKEKLSFAAQEFEQQEIKNVTLIHGKFSKLLPDILKDSNHPLMVFIDGDHSYSGTLEYYAEIKKYARPDTFVVFDDIRWSKDMEKAWREIKEDPATIINIDLFFMGIVFFREGITKQNFVINF
jgi:predicted O-methyltransferase YrrM